MTIVLRCAKLVPMSVLAALMAGLFAWTFIEYVIHAWLSHTFQTFATPFHQGHHQDPHNVFAVRLWLPLALLWIAVLAISGSTTGVIFLTGILAGFVIYEWVHYRIHFAPPRGRIVSWLRTRHLIHHMKTANRCFGVTSNLWDRAFGSDLNAVDIAAFGAAAAATPPLTGPCNIRKLSRVGLMTLWRR